MLSKRISIFVLVIALVLVISMAGFAANPIIIKLSHGDTADGSYGTCDNGALTFQRLVESRSDGRIKIEIYPNCQLGGEREQFESVMMGTTQMTWCSTAPLTGWIPELMVFSIPYLFPSTTVAFKVLDGEFGKAINDLLIEKTGLRFLGYGHIGFRHFTNNVRPIHTPEDMKGLKFRTREDPAEMQIIKSLGGSPTPISWAELYTSLQQGVIDGEENPTSMIQVAKLYEVQKYLTLDGHVFGVNPLTINEKFYQSLPEDLKYIVANSAKDALIAYRGMILFGEGLDVDDLSAKGMEIYAPTPKEIALFKEAAQAPVEAFVIEKIGDDWVNKLHEAIENAEMEFSKEVE